MAKKTHDFARIFTAQPALPYAHIVSVECDVSRGLHAFTIVGLPDKAVEEAKDRVASAIKNSDLESPKRSNKKIVVSLAPAELKKEGAVFDLAIALSYLHASEQLSCMEEDVLVVGELALDGHIQPVRGALSIAQAAKRNGFTAVILPKDNAEEASLISGITLFPVETLGDVIHYFAPKPERTRTPYKPPTQKKKQLNDDTSATLDDIRGQESAKRGLEIAIAGRHNIALYGPPGTGKTMLARAAHALLPELDEDEMIEVTTIHSLAGSPVSRAITHPPFRAPHHTSSYASLIGGGSLPSPGEVTLAHRGILFLDEFPEFHRDVINALREPLEDKRVSVARARASSVFPANFMLIAALNPCPCGHYGTRACTCMPHIVEKYRRKISGPIADRIDMWVSVQSVPLTSLTLRVSHVHKETAAAQERILKARTLQHTRFKNTKRLSTNADMGARDLETHAHLTSSAEKTLEDAAQKLKLSARGYHRTIKLARTIADLAGSSPIETPHMLEALQYRVRDF